MDDADDDRTDKLRKIDQQQALIADTITGLLNMMREKLMGGGFTGDQAFDLCQTYLRDVVPMAFMQDDDEED